MQEADKRHDGRQIYTEQFNAKGFGQTQQEISPYYVIQQTQRNVRFYTSILTCISSFFFFIFFEFMLNQWSTLKSVEVTSTDQNSKVFLLRKQEAQ